MSRSVILATTKVDAHNTKIHKEALEGAADDICNGKYAIPITIEHDLTTMPIGKIIKAHVGKYDDNDYALYAESDIFESNYLILDGQTYVFLKSTIDDRPFSSDVKNDNDKLSILTDSVNFESYDAANDFFEELRRDCDIETSYIFRKSVIPDPELIFQLVETSVNALFIYLASKTALEKIENHVLENALTELDNLYATIKTVIFSAVKHFRPKNRPVTYVFQLCRKFLIEFIVQTADPNIVLESLAVEKLLDALDAIERLQSLFSNFLKIQLVYDIDEKVWKFNYLTTEKGEVIGTELAYNATMRKFEIAVHNEK